MVACTSAYWRASTATVCSALAWCLLHQNAAQAADPHRLGSSLKLPSSTPSQDCASVLASACGDPHFKGFDGTAFQFLGSRDSCYNLLSEQDHQVNARFITAGSHSSSAPRQQQQKQQQQPTWMGEVALKYKEDILRVRVVPASGSMAVLVNGVPLAAAAGSVTRQQLRSGARFAYRTQPLAGSAGEPRLLVVTPSMSIAIRALAHPLHHLDVMVLAISPYLCGVHGILGQTYKRMYTEGDASGQAPFSLEGAEWDYELADILSDEFIFNRFKVPEEGCNSSSNEEEASNAAAGDMGATAPLTLGTVREQKQQQQQPQRGGSQVQGYQVQALAAAYDASSLPLSEA